MQTDTQRDGAHGMMEAEAGEVRLQGKEHPGSPANGRGCREARNRWSPRAIRRGVALPTPGFRLNP